MEFRMPMPTLTMDPVADAEEQLRRALAAGRRPVPAVAPGTSVLPQARRVSSGGSLSNGRLSGEDLVRQGLEMYGTDDDYSKAQAYARQRAKEGDSSMLNALAAQFAGESFQPVQAQYLKRAMAAREPIQVGNAMVGPDGNVVVDPAALRQRRADKLIQLGQFEMGLQDRQDARREAAALRQSLAAVRGVAGGTSAPASIQAGDQRAIRAADDQAAAGGRAYDALSQMSEIMTRYKGGLIAPEIGMGQRALAAMGNDAAAAKVQDFERLQQLASTVGIETLSQIGGNDTDRELQTAIRTAFDSRNLTESNLPLIRLKAAAARVAMERPSEMSEWVARTGSMMYPDPQTGETWPRYWMRRQQEIKAEFGLKPSGNLQVNGTQQSTSGTAAAPAQSSSKIVVDY